MVRNTASTLALSPSSHTTVEGDAVSPRYVCSIVVMAPALDAAAWTAISPTTRTGITSAAGVCIPSVR